MARQSLSTIQPDFEGILSQLQSYLHTKESWISLRKSSTSEILLEGISMVGEYDQYSIGAAVAETTFDNAHLPESIYTNSRFLGIRISRKIPAHCTCTLQNTDIDNAFLEIPIFTQFDIDGKKYFNREPIIFNSSTLIQNVELYQGEIKSSTFTASGLAYQTYILEEKEPWVISDTDIICSIDNVRFIRSTDAVFQFSISDTKFFENSLPSGNVECKFGNGIYGVIPQAESLIEFKYAVTEGSLGNNSTPGLQIKCDNYKTVIGETITNAYDGGDEKNLDFYKELGPENGASNGRCIVREDWKPRVLEYPGIIDCDVYGQAEIAPNDKNWMNVIGLMLLTEDGFDTNSFKGLVSYLKGKSIFGFQYKWFKPVNVNVDIKVRLYMKNNANLTETKEKITGILQEFLKLRLGSLGRSLYKSDIEDLIFSTFPDSIDYINFDYPQIDYVINKNQYIKLRTLDIQVFYSERDNQDWVNKIDPYNFKI